MPDVYETRRQNLLSLINIYGSVAKLNEVLGRKRYDGTLHQIKNKTKTPSSSRERTMGAEIARNIEIRLHLPPGWMDVTHLGSEENELKSSDSYLKSTINRIKSYKINDNPPSNILNHIFEGEMKLSDFFIKSVLNPTSEENLRFIPITDNSLKSVVKEGDALIVDFGVNEFKKDGVYLIKIGDKEMIRFISINYEGGYIIRTDDYSQILSDISKIKILARGIYVCSGTRI